MPANPRSSKHTNRPGSGRVTPKGTRPPGADRRTSATEADVDHHLDTSRSANAHGRAAPPPVPPQRTNPRGGR